MDERTQAALARAILEVAYKLQLEDLSKLLVLGLELAEDDFLRELVDQAAARGMASGRFLDLDDSLPMTLH